jgi:hypothetical protein
MFQFTDYIDVRAFFISLFIGIMIAYVLAPHKKYIIAYPTPENAHEKIYENEGSCVKYDSKEITCPKDSSQIQQTGITAPVTEEKDVIIKTLRKVLQHDS